MRVPKWIALWWALRDGTLGPEQRKRIKRSIGARYAKRKPKAAT